MASWKTTLCGLAGAIAVAWQPYLTLGRAPSISELILAAAVGAMGWAARDHSE